jgi:hypothetical protein
MYACVHVRVCALFVSVLSCRPMWCEVYWYPSFSVAHSMLTMTERRMHPDRIVAISALYGPCVIFLGRVVRAGRQAQHRQQQQQQQHHHQ